MQGTHLRFYTYENRKHGGALLYEWLLEFAKARGIHGGSAFLAWMRRQSSSAGTSR